MSTTPVLHVVIPGDTPPAPRARFGIMPAYKGALDAFRDFVQTETGWTLKDMNKFFRVFPLTKKRDPYPPWKEAAKLLMNRARVNYCGSKPFVSAETPLEVRILVVRELPKGERRKTVEKMPLRAWCISLLQGDVDNLAKGPLDAAKGVLWHDDKQVAALTIEKVVGAQDEKPRCELMVWPLDRSAASKTNYEESRDAIRSADRLHGDLEVKEGHECPPVTGDLPF